MSHIFLIEDDEKIRRLVIKYLEREGYKVTSFENADNVLSEFKELNPDAIISDIMMPGTQDGLDICKQIRAFSDVPIIFISAKDDTIDKVLGLELCADDYLAKPFSPRELLVRLKNILKRRETAVSRYIELEKKNEGVYTFKDIEVDSDRRTCKVKGKELHLTRKEYELLVFLINNTNISFTREGLCQKIWDEDWVSYERRIDDLVKRLRKILASAESIVEITTVWGYGYRLDEN